MKTQTLEMKGVDAGKAVSPKFEVGGKKAAYVLGICSLLYAFNYGDRLIFSVAAAPLMKALSLTKTEVGWINNGLLLTMGGLAIPISTLWTGGAGQRCSV